MNLEVRAPLFGLLTGELTYGPLPIEAIAFVDAGFLWTRHAGSPLERDRFRSIGAGARANIGGLDRRDGGRQAVRPQRQRLDPQLPPPTGLVVGSG